MIHSKGSLTKATSDQPLNQSWAATSSPGLLPACKATVASWPNTLSRSTRPRLRMVLRTLPIRGATSPPQPRHSYAVVGLVPHPLSIACTAHRRQSSSETLPKSSSGLSPRCHGHPPTQLQLYTLAFHRGGAWLVPAFGESFRQWETKLQTNLCFPLLTALDGRQMCVEASV